MTMQPTPAQDLLEESLLASLGARAPDGPSAVFVLGSPRTGSTLIYQALSFGLALPYIANLTNDHYAASPIVGLALQAGLRGQAIPSYKSRYGKTAGLLQPSEGSAVMRRWFGGDHPSQSRSARFLDGARAHCEATLRASLALSGRPLAVKNPWNCFRVADLASLESRPVFIWIRRDIADAAKSDLSARYVVQGSNAVWNSATPANVESLRLRPYWEQVVENQFEFNRALGEALPRHAPGRFVELWYERFCADPHGELKRLARSLSLPEEVNVEALRAPEVAASAKDWQLSDGDAARIDAYLDAAGDRLRDYRFRFRS